ncbi:hypothetical protein Ddye_029015 [Dipteronia dyeriana]|uniref:SWIM-type domain-containing protein n=1 Tax=Dipteronia dyeriana TaxID=168575 RepID=A0AAD9TET8_9ROSI|nr:hypothetical protein Ddye_029015 [Dipteronia dyeriana]
MVIIILGFRCLEIRGLCLFYGSQLGMKIFKITVFYRTKVIDLGQCDADHISLITLVYALSEKVSGSNAVPEEQYTVWAHLPWSSDTVEVRSDSELIEIFREFEFHRYDNIGFQIGHGRKKPHTPIIEYEEVEAIGWCDKKAIMFDYEVDNEGEVKESGEGESIDGYEREGIDGLEGDEGQQSHDGYGEGLQFDDGHEGGEGPQFDDRDDIYGHEGDDGLQSDGGEEVHVDDEDGQTFDNMVVLRDIFRDYVIQEGVVLARVKNDLIRQTYKCIALGCLWRAHASYMIDKTTFMLKTLVDRHECHRVYNNKEAKVKWIASKFETQVKSNQTISVKVIGDLLREKFNVAIDIKRLYRTKHRALIGGVRFIGLDGCYLKGPCEGVLLSAVALDANSGIFPLAVCICEKETTNSWLWFLNNLNMFLLYSAEKHLTFMYDRQKWVITTLETNFPSANKRLSYPGDNYKKLFWKANKSCNVFEFKDALNEIGEIEPRAKVWLEKIEPQYWSRFGHDKMIRCDHVTNNMIEAFNSMLGTHRAVTYLQLLKFIRRMIMMKFQERNEECATWMSVLPPRVDAKIVKNSTQSGMLTIIADGDMEYELLCPDGSYAIKLRQYNCGCGSWQISGIPCCHAMAAISHSYGRDPVKDKVVAFVHQSLSKSVYIQIYMGMIHPIHDQKMWPYLEGLKLILPPFETQPGRPKLQRKKEPDEKSRGGRSGIVVCKCCGMVGHNKRT